MEKPKKNKSKSKSEKKFVKQDVSFIVGVASGIGDDVFFPTNFGAVY